MTLYDPGEPFPVDPPDFSGEEGTYRYLNFLRDDDGNPVTSCLSSPSFLTYYACATLRCDPEYADWSDISGGEIFHVTGNAVIPDSIYGVAHLAASCMGIEETYALASEEVEIASARYGDADLSGVVNVTDVVITVDVMKAVEGAVWEYQCYVCNPVPVPHKESCNVTEIVLHDDALKLVAYPLPISECP